MNLKNTTITENTLFAEYDKRMQAYRVYCPMHPLQIVAYVKTFEESARSDDRIMQIVFEDKEI